MEILIRATPTYDAGLHLQQPAQQLCGPEPSPVQDLPHQPIHRRVHDSGHLFPCLLASVFLLRLQQARGDVVMPAGPDAGLIFTHAYVALARLELSFNVLAGAGHGHQLLTVLLIGCHGVNRNRVGARVTAATEGGPGQMQGVKSGSNLAAATSCPCSSGLVPPHRQL